MAVNLFLSRADIGVSRIVLSWEDKIFRRGAEIFPPLGHNRKDWAECLIMTKERLVLASAPYAPHESSYA